MSFDAYSSPYARNLFGQEAADTRKEKVIKVSLPKKTTRDAGDVRQKSRGGFGKRYG